MSKMGPLGHVVRVRIFGEAEKGKSARKKGKKIKNRCGKVNLSPLTFHDLSKSPKNSLSLLSKKSESCFDPSKISNSNNSTLFAGLGIKSCLPEILIQ